MTKKPAAAPKKNTTAPKRGPLARAKSPAAKSMESSSEDVPRTPPRKKQRVKVAKGVMSLKPGEKSPTKMANGHNCVGCDHDRNILSLRVMETGWLTVGCINSKDNYPSKCHGCDKSFVKDRDELFGTSKCKKPVRACENAYNHRDHPCTYALCQCCWLQKVEEQKGAKHERTRRMRKRMIL